MLSGINADSGTQLRLLRKVHNLTDLIAIYDLNITYLRVSKFLDMLEKRILYCGSNIVSYVEL